MNPSFVQISEISLGVKFCHWVHYLDSLSRVYRNQLCIELCMLSDLKLTRDTMHYGIKEVPQQQQKWKMKPVRKYQKMQFLQWPLEAGSNSKSVLMKQGWSVVVPFSIIGDHFVLKLILTHEMSLKPLQYPPTFRNKQDFGLLRYFLHSRATLHDSWVPFESLTACPGVTSPPQLHSGTACLSIFSLARTKLD